MLWHRELSQYFRRLDSLNTPNCEEVKYERAEDTYPAVASIRTRLFRLFHDKLLRGCSGSQRGLLDGDRSHACLLAEIAYVHNDG